MFVRRRLSLVAKNLELKTIDDRLTQAFVAFLLSFSASILTIEQYI